jgi:hypothetical protein
MKKYLYLLFIGFAFNVAQSQEIQDGVRFAQDNLNGTARFRAMGGAFGALGGDLSAINVNPAGSAIFSNNQLTLSLSNFNTKNNSTYFGTNTSDSNNSFDLNQTGGVFVFKNQNPSSNWKKFSVAINYEKTNDFDNSVFSAGTNPTNSVDKYFLSYANADPQQNQPGIPLGTIQNYYYEELNFADQQAFLGYEGYIINAIPLASDPLNDKNPNITSYSTNIPAGGNYYQENEIISKGYNGKLSFNAATSYKDKLYLGINLNSHFTDYTQSTSFYEDNNNSQTNGLRSLRFNNDQYTYGTGFSFQIGAIAKVTNEIRLGFAYESSIWYHLADKITQNLTSRGFNYGNPPISGLSNASTDSNLEITYDPYNLQTPSKITGSLAYVFGKTGLISLDYGLKNYSNTKYTEQPDFRSYNINSKLKNELNNTSELRIGAEYKIKEWSLRGGYRFEESPYKNKTTIGDLNSFSGGLGYNFGMFKLDFAYTNAQRNAQQPFFNHGFTDGAKINTKNNNFTMTLLFEM